MAVLIKLPQKGVYEYILKVEQDGYFENRLSNLTDEKEIEAVRKLQKETEEKITRYGKTIWLLEYVPYDKVLLATTHLKNIVIFNGSLDKESITSNLLAFQELKKITAYKLGIRGWKNLRDINGNEISFNMEMVDMIPKEIQIELGGSSLND
ncbi:MAG: hypothetical protein QMD44_05950 [Thermodesulfovibrionales bacterium]|nr:hypothetical protein [Thermodesulfovibrionales bacterium]